MTKVERYMQHTLRSLRVKQRYSLKEAAALLGIHPCTLRNWEKDSSRLPFHKVQQLEEVYHTPQDYIFFGNEFTFSKQIKKNQQTITDKHVQALWRGETDHV